MTQRLLLLFWFQLMGTPDEAAKISSTEADLYYFFR